MFKAIIKIGFIVVFVFGLSQNAYSSSKANMNLYERLSDQETINVFVEDFIDSTDKKDVDTQRGKLSLINALKDRITIKFIVIDNRDMADIVIKTKITEKIWTEDDPVDMITGIGPIIFDTLKKENYARIQAEFTVIDPKKGKTLWAGVEKATITDEKMSEDDSSDLLNERIVKVFMRKCFSKNAGKRRKH